MKMNGKIWALAALGVLASCTDDPIEDVAGAYERGVFVSCEGGFGHGNGSVSFISDDGSVENSVFEAVNARPLGDVVQSMYVDDSLAYIMVNASNKIEVVEAGNMESVETITSSVGSPRYALSVSSDKLYVSDWMNGVLVIDKEVNSVVKTISVGSGAERMAVVENHAFVCNAGGFGLDSTVSVIDVETDEVIANLEVGHKPSSIQVDMNGHVWVLAEGHTEYSVWPAILWESAGQLVKINPATLTIEESYAFPVGEHPSHLTINEAGDELYFMNGGWSKAVYAHGIYDLAFSTTPLIAKNFYGLGVHEGYVYGADAKDFVQNGWVYRYTSAGLAVDSFEVGIIANGFAF